jgi:hypothetical protein
MPLHPDVQALSRAMHELAAYLRKHDEAGWADEVDRCAGWVDQSDAYGLTRFLSLFGGMGSLNDVVLYRDGAPLRHENEELDRLSSNAFRLATDLNREQS